MPDEIIKKKKHVSIIDPDRPFFGPMSMWKELDTIFDAFRRQFDNHMMHPFRPFMVNPILESRTRLPAMDFKETEDSFILTAEIPGVPKEEIDITLTGTKIEITAQTGEERKEEGDCFVCQERISSNFKRVFEFPKEIVPDRSEATMKNGVLEIMLPKKEPEPKVEAKKSTLRVQFEPSGSLT